MKLAQICAAAACVLLLTASTRGIEVSSAQIDQFRKGVATLADVEAKLGMPQRSGPSANGGTVADYILMDTSANAASYVPFAREVAGAMNVHEMRVEFEFDAAGHLVGAQTSTRDLVCPHRVCSGQMDQPWTPVATQGD